VISLVPGVQAFVVKALNLGFDELLKAHHFVHVDGGGEPDAIVAIN